MTFLMRFFLDRDRALGCMALLGIAVTSGAPAAPGQSDSPSKDTPSVGQPAAEPATATFDSENPLAKESGLPFQAPVFDRISDEDFQPAIETGIKRQKREVARIAHNDAKPTFENTIAALEKSGRLLERTLNVFNALAGANTNKALQRVERIAAPKLAEHTDTIYLNTALFERVARLYETRDTRDLGPEQQRLLTHYYKKFVHHGARLSAADKNRLRDINQQLSSKSTEFTQRLLAANKAQSPVFQDKTMLAGLPKQRIQAAARSAADNGIEDGYRISLQNTTQQPQLADMTHRGAREKLFKASWLRAQRGDANDTRELIRTLAALRADKAALMGYETFADYKLYDQMAKTPEAAIDFMQRLSKPAVTRANAEAADLQNAIRAAGKDFKLEPWDWNFYTEKLRKKRYDLDESEIKPYFALDNVLEKGVFHAAHELYGLRFTERDDLPVYHPDVRVYTVHDADGSKLGLFYADYFKRDNKRGGAWMSNFVDQSTLLGTQPVIYNVCNFAKPAPGDPALLSYDDVITMFHEFGHALHGFFANTTYPSLSGTATPRDFVEFPSQFYEHWATVPAVFDRYALHYKTGKPMPAALKDKLMAAADFNQGYGMTELISAALLDMAWHTLPNDAVVEDTEAFQQHALREAGVYLPHKVPPRYSSSYFQHIWGNGYSAGYYAYLWTQMLADNGFDWFKAHGGLTRENGDRFRRMILSIGNTRDLKAAYVDWLGHEPDITPMLQYRGLAAEPPGTGNLSETDASNNDTPKRDKTPTAAE